MPATSEKVGKTSTTGKTVSQPSKADSSMVCLSTQMGVVWTACKSRTAVSANRREDIRAQNYTLTEDRIWDLEMKLEAERSFYAVSKAARQKKQQLLQWFSRQLERETARLEGYAAKVSTFNTKVPREVIAMILHLALFEGGTRLPDQYTNPESHVDRLQDLRLVCSYWDTIIVQSAEFWTSRAYRLPVQSSLSADEWIVIHTELDARRTVLPLHLIIQVDEEFLKPPPPPPRVPPPPSFQRHHKLAYSVYMPTLDLLSTKAERITMRGMAAGCHPPLLPPNLTGLKRLELTTVSILAATRFYLCDMPNLEVFTVENSFCAIPGPVLQKHRDAIVLNKLRHFSFRSRHKDPSGRIDDPFMFLQDIALPALQHIILSFPPGANEFKARINSFEEVRRLELGPFWDQSPIAIVTTMGNLEELAVDGYLGKFQEGKVTELLFVGHFLERLARPASSQPELSSLAPRLKSLNLRACAFTPTNIVKLLNGWQKKGVLHTKHIAFEDCWLGSTKRPKGQRAFLKSKFKSFEVGWHWEWTGRFAGTELTPVKVDGADSTAEREDAQAAKIEDEAEDEIRKD